MKDLRRQQRQDNSWGCGGSSGPEPSGPDHGVRVPDATARGRDGEVGSRGAGDERLGGVSEKRRAEGAEQEEEGEGWRGDPRREVRARRESEVRGRGAAGEERRGPGAGAREAGSGPGCSRSGGERRAPLCGRGRRAAWEAIFTLQVSPPRGPRRDGKGEVAASGA